MKKRKLLYILVILVCGCSAQKTKSLVMFENYKKSVSPKVFTSSIFSDSLIQNSYAQNILFCDAIYASGYSGVFITNEYDSTEFQKLDMLLKKENKYKSKLIDSCNFYISSDQTTELNACVDKKFPLPKIGDNFNRIQDVIGVGNSYFFLLDTEYGNFFNDKVCSELNDEITIRDNGFSNGLILDYSTNKIVSWLIVW